MMNKGTRIKNSIPMAERLRDGVNLTALSAARLSIQKLFSAAFAAPIPS
jgi:hypothetical protein